MAMTNCRSSPRDFDPIPVHHRSDGHIDCTQHSISHEREIKDALDILDILGDETPPRTTQPSSQSKTPFLRQQPHGQETPSTLPPWRCTTQQEFHQAPQELFMMYQHPGGQQQPQQHHPQEAPYHYWPDMGHAGQPYKQREVYLHHDPFHHNMNPSVQDQSRNATSYGKRPVPLTPFSYPSDLCDRNCSNGMQSVATRTCSVEGYDSHGYTEKPELVEPYYKTSPTSYTVQPTSSMRACSERMRYGYLTCPEPRNLFTMEKTNHKEDRKMDASSEHPQDNPQTEHHDNEENDEEEEDRTPIFFCAHQEAKWQERYDELVQYKSVHGTTCVPNKWTSNFALAQWVKRQRYQCRLKHEGKPSTMTKERHVKLEKLGFVWDLHSSIWEERFNELIEFRNLHGHCKVPIKYTENPELAIWAKCQRRHFKLYMIRRGTESNQRSCMSNTRTTSTCTLKSNTMNDDRFRKLTEVGFVFRNRS